MLKQAALLIAAVAIVVILLLRESADNATRRPESTPTSPRPGPQFAVETDPDYGGSLQSLIEAIRLGSEEERVAAAVKVAELRAVEAVPALIEAIEAHGGLDDYHFERAIACVGVPALPLVMEALRAGGDEDVQTSLVDALAMMAPAAATAVPLLLNLLDNTESVGLRGAIQRALMDVGAGAIPALIRRLQRGGDVGFRPDVTFAAIGKPAAAALGEALSHADPKVRRWAAIALAEMGRNAQPALEQLHAALASDKAAAFAPLLKAIAAIGESAAPAAPTLVKLLESDDSEMPTPLIIEALGRIGSLERGSLDGIRRALVSGCAETRDAAALALWRIAGDVDTLEHHCRTLAQVMTPETASRLARLVAEAGSHVSSVAPALINYVANEPHLPEEVSAALAALGAQAVPPLIEALEQGSPGTQRRILRVIERMGVSASEAAPILTTLAARGTSETRASALRALRSVGVGQSSVPILVDYLREGGELACEAARCLGAMGPVAKAAVPELCRALQYPDPYVVSSAISALGDIGPDASPSVPLLSDLLFSGHAYRAIDALGRIGPGSVAAAGRIRSYLDSPKLLVRASAAIALWRITAEPESETVLLDALSTPIVHERVEIVRSCQQLVSPPRQVVQVLIAQLDHESWGVREAVARTLATIRPAPASALARLRRVVADESEDERVRAAARWAIARSR